jgi:hypothetical protein
MSLISPNGVEADPRQVWGEKTKEKVANHSNWLLK